jgi:hypothetical protein
LTTSKDAWIDKTNPDSNLGGDSNLHVRPTSGSDHQSLIQFESGGVPPGASISSAILELFQKDSKNQTINVYRITQAWGQGTVTWNNQPGSDSFIWASFSGSASVPLTRSIEITALVQAWADGDFPNFGLLLKSVSGSGDIQFSSREGGNPPALTVVYCP